MYKNTYNRFIPVAPFLLGAVTGGVAVAAFNPYRPRPYYNYPPGPYYNNSYYSGYNSYIY